MGASIVLIGCKGAPVRGCRVNIFSICKNYFNRAQDLSINLKKIELLVMEDRISGELLKIVSGEEGKGDWIGVVPDAS